MAMKKGTPQSVVRFQTDNDLRPAIARAAEAIQAESGKKCSANDFILAAIEEKLAAMGVKPGLNQYAMKMQKQVVAKNGPYTIVNPYYLEENQDSQRYKSLSAQRTSFLEFHRYMFSLSDERVQRLHHNFKDFCLEQRLCESDHVYLDVQLLQDAIAYQLALRSPDMFDVFAVTKDISQSWRSNIKTAIDFDDVTSERLIELADEILSQ
ncbi:hypothetical protein [Desulfovibrio oxyclinae]|uniref:hypothetical protein n=1 Tax=Desulfovibrio oxyclinae TaxID=63560 RepID=UPI00036A3E30|nr:hypothetical protein [Desulfovibrio oxyclinae]